MFDNSELQLSEDAPDRAIQQWRRKYCVYGWKVHSYPAAPALRI